MSEKFMEIPVEPPDEIKKLLIPVSPEYIRDSYAKDEFMVFVGPQHGGSGHMRIIVRLRGDVIIEARPDPGYVHRGIEKLAEDKLYISNIPLVERPCIVDSANFNLGYVRAIERMLDIEVPEKAKLIRTLLAEICRIGSHLYDAGILLMFLGLETGFMWSFGIREAICECLSRISGARIATSYILPGGVRRGIKNGVLDYINETMSYIEKKMDKYDRFLIRNPTTIERLSGVGVLEKRDAMKFNVVGPALRASGVEYDTREIEPYETYDELEWDVVVADDGDAYSRFLVRIGEIEQSIRMIRQVIRRLRDVEDEKVITTDILKGKKVEEIAKDIMGNLYTTYARLSLSAGETTTVTEAARGTLLYTLISDGESTTPYRLRVVTPSWLYLRGFMESLKGCRLADLQAIYGSFGYFPPESDR